MVRFGIRGSNKGKLISSFLKSNPFLDKNRIRSIIAQNVYVSEIPNKIQS